MDATLCLTSSVCVCCVCVCVNNEAQTSYAPCKPGHTNRGTVTGSVTRCRRCYIFGMRHHTGFPLFRKMYGLMDAGRIAIRVHNKFVIKALNPVCRYLSFVGWIGNIIVVIITHYKFGHEFPARNSAPNFTTQSSDVWYICIFIKSYRSASTHCKQYVRNSCLLYWSFSKMTINGQRLIPHKGQWREVLMFSLICSRIKGWVGNREAGDLRRHRAYYDVILMMWATSELMHPIIHILSQTC